MEFQEVDESVNKDVVKAKQTEAKILTRFVGRLLVESVDSEDLNYYCRKLQELRFKR